MSIVACTVVYSAYNGGYCYSHDWGEGIYDRKAWDGMEDLSGSYTIGMLLDFLDEGTLSVYKNGRKLGVMKGWRANTVGL